MLNNKNETCIFRLFAIKIIHYWKGFKFLCLQDLEPQVKISQYLVL